MGIYTFKDEHSLIKDIELVGSRKKPWAMHLFADPAADPEKLSAVSDALSKRGCHITPVMIDGKYALQVSGPKGGVNILGVLRSGGWASGTAEYVPSDEEKKEQSKSRFRRVLDHIGNNSLRYSGFFYFLGAMNILISGIRRGNATEAMSGLLYSVGDPVMMVYGQLSPKQQLSRVTERLIDQLHKQGIDIPENSALAQAEKKIKKGPLHSLNNFLASHPAEIELGFNAAGALQYLRANTHTLGTPIEVLQHEEATKKTLEAAGKSYDPIKHAYRGDKITTPPMANFTRGLKQIFTDPAGAKKSFAAIKEQMKVEKLANGHAKTNQFNAAVWGMLTGFGNSASAITSVIIPEKDHDDSAHEVNDGEKKKHGGLWAWIREKPLRVAGYVYALISFGYIREGMHMMHDPTRTDKAHINKFATGINYIVADLLLAVSPKNAGNRGSSGNAGAYRIAANIAEVVATLPVEEQNDTVQRIAGFLALQPEVKRSPKDMAALINEQLKARQDHPWLGMKVANDNVATKDMPAAQIQREQTPVADRLKRDAKSQFSNRFPQGSGHRNRVEDKRAPEAEPGVSAGPAIS